MTVNNCANKVTHCVTTGNDDSWFWGVSPIKFVCRGHVATAEPDVVASAQEATPDNGFHPGWAEEECQARWPA